MIKSLVGSEKTIARVLEKHPSTRNSDKELLIKVMEEFGLFLTPDQQDVFFNCPSMETITRCRRNLQSQGLYPSTSRVRRGRFKSEIEARNHFVAEKKIGRIMAYKKIGNTSFPVYEFENNNKIIEDGLF